MKKKQIEFERQSNIRHREEIEKLKESFMSKLEELSTKMAHMQANFGSHSSFGSHSRVNTIEVEAPIDTAPEVEAPMDTTPDVEAPIDTTPEVEVLMDTTPGVEAPVDTSILYETTTPSPSIHPEPLKVNSLIFFKK